MNGCWLKTIYRIIEMMWIDWWRCINIVGYVTNDMADASFEILFTATEEHHNHYDNAQQSDHGYIAPRTLTACKIQSHRSS